MDKQKETSDTSRLTPREMAQIIADAWKNLDISALREILAEDYEYTSQWVFDTMHGAETYLDYLSHKFEAMKRSGRPTVTDVRWNQELIEIDLMQSIDGESHKGMLAFDVKEGKVVRGCMCRPDFRRIDSNNDTIGFVFHSNKE